MSVICIHNFLMRSSSLRSLILNRVLLWIGLQFLMTRFESINQQDFQIISFQELNLGSSCPFSRSIGCSSWCPMLCLLVAWEDSSCSAVDHELICCDAINPCSVLTLAESTSSDAEGKRKSLHRRPPSLHRTVICVEQKDSPLALKTLYSENFVGSLRCYWTWILTLLMKT